MGDRRASTLKRKLIASGFCQDEEGVKRYLQEKCWVQVVLIPDANERTSFEYFAAAILKPTYNDDRNKQAK